MDNVKKITISHLQEMFKGQVDPDVVCLVLSECQYNAWPGGKSPHANSLFLNSVKQYHGQMKYDLDLESLGQAVMANVDDAVGQLLNLADEKDCGLTSGSNKLDDLDPIDIPLPNVHQIPCPFDKDSMNCPELELPSSENTKLNALNKCKNTNLSFPLESSSILQSANSPEGSGPKSLAVDGGPSLGAPIMFTNEGVIPTSQNDSVDLGIQNIGSPVIQSGAILDSNRNNETYISDEDDYAETRVKVSSFRTNRKSKDTGFKLQQFSNFDSNPKSSNQNKEKAKADSNFVQGYPRFSQVPQLPFTPRQNQSLYVSNQSQYFPSWYSVGFPSVMAAPNRTVFPTGHQGFRTIPQQVFRPRFPNGQVIPRRHLYGMAGSYKPRAIGSTRATKQEGLSRPAKKLLIILRGLPGSGKTTLARLLMTKTGVVISTDDYFMKGGKYCFNHNELGEAHEWNQYRAKRFMEGGLTPVIVDNTNTQAWEMKPYVVLGLRYGYKVVIKEPDTWWKWNVKELERKNRHGVSAKGLERMMERYEKNVTVDIIMKSVHPLPVDKSNGTEQEDGETSQNYKNLEKILGDSEPVVQIVSDGKTKNQRPSGNLLLQKGFPKPANPGVHTEKMGKHPKSPDVITPTVKETTRVKEKRTGDVNSSELDLNHIELKDIFDKSRKAYDTADDIWGGENVDGPKTVCNEEIVIADSRNEMCADRARQGGCTTEAVSKENAPVATTSSFIISSPIANGNVEASANLPSELLLVSSEKTENHVSLHQESSRLVLMDSTDDKTSLRNDVSDLLRSKQLSLQDNPPSLRDDTEVETITVGDKSCTDVERVGSTNNQRTSANPVQDKSSVISEKCLTSAVEMESRNTSDNVYGKDAVVSGSDQSKKSEHSMSKEAKNLVNVLDSGTETSLKDPNIRIIAEICNSKPSERISDFDETCSTKNSDSLVSTVTHDASDSTNILGNREACSVKNCDLEVVLQDSLKFLEDCFPDVDVSLLRSVLKDCRGNLVKTVDCLLECCENSDAENASDTDTSYQQGSSKTMDTTSTISFVNDSLAAQRVVGGGGESPPKTEHSKDMDRELDAWSTPKRFKKTPTPSIPLSTPSTPLSTPGDFRDISIDSLRLTLDPALALQLLEMFGSFSGVSAKDTLTEDSLSVKIDQEFAKLLYTKWRKTVQERNKSKCSEEKSVKKTNASPRPRESDGSSKKKFKTPPREFYLPENIQCSPPKPLTLHEPVSLKEIMDEQLAIHVSQKDKELEKSWKEENLDLSTKLKRSRLHGMFPGIDTDSLNEIFEANSYNLDKTVLQVQSSSGIPAAENLPILSPRASDAQPDTKHEVDLTCHPLLELVTEVDSGSLEFQSLDEPTYTDFRAEATTHATLRDECIKKAALAYSKKQGELARIYADQARAHTEKIKEANHRAAGKILEIRNNDLRTSNTLDLHELHVNEAIQVLEAVLKERKEEIRSPDRKSPAFIQVITGRGNRSRDGKPRIKPAVIEHLKRNGYRYEELNSGLYRVFLD